MPEPVRQTARAGEPDRYLAALLAPRAVRGDLIALAAFAAEIARVPDLVSDPAIGEIRLAWWREHLERGNAGVRTGNPIADALRDASHRHALSAGTLIALIDARAALLYRDRPEDDLDFVRFFAETEGALFSLAGQIAAPGLARWHAAILASAGQIYGSARMLLGAPRLHARARAETRAGLARLRPELKALPRALRTVLLPLALVEPYLRASERAQRNESQGLEQLMPLTRVYRIWMAHAFGRF